MLSRPAGALIVMLLATACAQHPVDDFNQVMVHVDGAEFVLENQTSRTVYYFAVDRELAALVDWAPCPDPAHCEGVPVGGQRRLSSAEVHGMTPETRAVVFYTWHLIPLVGGGYHVRMQDELVVGL